MERLLKGIDSLSQKNIMHRDIKPGNILVQRKYISQEATLVIENFGLASYTEVPRYLYERCGTPGYVAPEICNFKTGDRLSSKCDIFSVGVIFHIMLCKTALFLGDTFKEVYKKNKQMDIDYSHPKYNLLDKDALDLIKKMLTKDQYERISY